MENNIAATFEGDSNEELDIKVETMQFKNEKVDVVFNRPPVMQTNIPVLRTGETSIVDGILIEHDIPLKMRDGVTLYVDVFRPEGATNIPTLIAFGFSRLMYGMKEHGVPPGTASSYRKFESPEPFYWCHYGYAVVNIDARGGGMSDGDATWWSTKVGEDGYDIVEWVASQEWSSGKVGAFGNSSVAAEIVQTAIQQPPHLTCIAPWETTTDVYRGYLSPGGIPEVKFCSVINRMQQGYKNQFVEDLVANRKKYPFMNGFWEDKIFDLENVEVPMYSCVGWSHFHLRGSIDLFTKAATPKKWVRAHREFEWEDDWTPANVQELHMFFDRYLKGIHNGWELTPKVRLDVMDSYAYDYQVKRPENEWPLARTQYTKMFLDARNTQLSFDEVKESSSISYDSTNDHAVFTHAFKEDTEITGHMKLRLWVEADDAEDMDLFVFVQKESADGELLPTSVIKEPHPGATGMMRVSMRELDEEKSTPYQPVQSLKRYLPLKKGEIVPVDIEILPTCRIWHSGEKLRVVISGRYERKEGWFEPFAYDIINIGNHIIHTGDQYDSHLLVPIIPPKFKAGDYIYR